MKTTIPGLLSDWKIETSTLLSVEEHYGLNGKPSKAGVKCKRHRHLLSYSPIITPSCEMGQEDPKDGVASWLAADWANPERSPWYDPAKAALLARRHHDGQTIDRTLKVQLSDGRYYDGALTGLAVGTAHNRIWACGKYPLWHENSGWFVGLFDLDHMASDVWLGDSIRMLHETPLVYSKRQTVFANQGADSVDRCTLSHEVKASRLWVHFSGATFATGFRLIPFDETLHRLKSVCHIFIPGLTYSQVFGSRRDLTRAYEDVLADTANVAKEAAATATAAAAAAADAGFTIEAATKAADAAAAAAAAATAADAAAGTLYGIFSSNTPVLCADTQRYHNNPNDPTTRSEYFLEQDEEEDRTTIMEVKLLRGQINEFDPPRILDLKNEAVTALTFYEDASMGTYNLALTVCNIGGGVGNAAGCFLEVHDVTWFGRDWYRVRVDYKATLLSNGLRDGDTIPDPKPLWQVYQCAEAKRGAELGGFYENNPINQAAMAGCADVPPDEYDFMYTYKGTSNFIELVNPPSPPAPDWSLPAVYEQAETAFNQRSSKASMENIFTFEAVDGEPPSRPRVNCLTNPGAKGCPARDKIYNTEHEYPWEYKSCTHRVENGMYDEYGKKYTDLVRQLWPADACQGLFMCTPAWPVVIGNVRTRTQHMLRP